MELAIGFEPTTC